MIEYKVITERDSAFSGTFDLAGLEAALNEYGAQGWRVASSLMAASLWKSFKAEIMIVLERERV